MADSFPEHPRILVTNDDGIYSPGLEVLARVAHALSSDVWVVAPEYEQSGASHSLTLVEPLRIRELSPRRFAVRGTPTDCVMLGVHRIIEGRRPDIVFSGINRGGNLGEDVTYSGTIAAAMEGTLLEIPSIALSQTYHFRGGNVRWETAEEHAPDVVRRLMQARWPKDVLININFPDVEPDEVKGVSVTVQGKRDTSDMIIDEREDPRGTPYYWFGFRRMTGEPGEETDLHAVGEGCISVTPLHLDLTHWDTKAELTKIFKTRRS